MSPRTALTLGKLLNFRIGIIGLSIWKTEEAGRQRRQDQLKAALEAISRPE
jgi:hypothetical protein